MWKELGYQIAVIAVGTWCVCRFMALVQSCRNELKEKELSTVQR